MNTPDEVVGPINLGNPVEFTIKQLAEMVVELVGSKSRLIHAPLPSDDPKQRQPDITLACEILAWEPKVALREGLAKTVVYFDELLRNDNRP
jgi:UDP-glucuronate decarboxylase